MDSIQPTRRARRPRCRSPGASGYGHEHRRVACLTGLIPLQPCSRCSHAFIAKPATSRTPTRSSLGLHPRAAPAPITKACKARVTARTCVARFCVARSCVARPAYPPQAVSAAERDRELARRGRGASPAIRRRTIRSRPAAGCFERGAAGAITDRPPAPARSPPRLPGDSGQAPARGVYLWGGVGRGKTLLMNMFYAATPGAQRSHFYHFMRDVHAELADIKHAAQPLEIVARRLAARARVICLDEVFRCRHRRRHDSRGTVGGAFPPRGDAGRDVQFAAARSVQGRSAAPTLFAGHRTHTSTRERRASRRRNRLPLASTRTGSHLFGFQPSRDTGGSAASLRRAGRRHRDRAADSHRRRTRAACGERGTGHGVLSLQRTLRGTAQSERLHRTRAGGSHHLHREHPRFSVRRTKTRRGGSSCSSTSSTIEASRSWYRPPRRRPRCIAASGCIRVRAGRQPPHRDADT